MEDTIIWSASHLSLSRMEQVAHKLSDYLRPGDYVALTGDLGMGKSTFARKLIRTLLADDHADVPSPTFTLVQTYALDGAREVWHADLYRLENPEDVYDLGFEEMEDVAFFLVEWPDRLPADMYTPALKIAFSASEQTSRDITISGNADWQDRLSTIPGVLP